MARSARLTRAARLTGAGRLTRAALAIGLTMAMVLSLAVGLTAAVRPVLAQEEAPALSDEILVVDLNRILRDAAAVQVLQEQVGAAREAFQAEIRQREDALRQRDQELARQRPQLTPEEYEARRAQLANELAQLQSDVQERRRQLDQAMNEGMRQVQAVLLPILQRLTEERGASILLSKTSIVLVRPELEITEQALQVLDETLPSVTVLPSN